MSETIGIIGTGRMGTAFAQRLMACGFKVGVWNRSPQRTQAAQSAGAIVADGLQNLVASSDVLISSLTHHDAVMSILDQIEPASLVEKLFIEMSTLKPEEQVAVATHLQNAGAVFVECPVGGTVGPALKGALLGLAAGDREGFERARPILESLCKRVDFLGEPGTGAAMKLAVNLPLALYWATLAESLSVLHASGLDGQTIASLLAESSAGPNVLRNRLDVVAATLDGQDQPGTFDIDGLTKDLQAAIEVAAQSGASTPLAQAALAHYRDAQQAGLGGMDGASLSRFVSRSG